MNQPSVSNYILSYADVYVAVASSRAARMHQSSALTRLVSNRVANLKATNKHTIVYTVVNDANISPVFDSWGRLQRSACTFAVPSESAIVQFARMHAAVLYASSSLAH